MEIREAIQRSRPYGSEEWVSGTVAKFGLEDAMRNPGRPKVDKKPYLTPFFPPCKAVGDQLTLILSNRDEGRYTRTLMTAPAYQWAYRYG
jgi:hypothetical protein